MSVTIVVLIKIGASIVAYIGGLLTGKALVDKHEKSGNM